jgi:transcriptional regulator with XRE-family HTH domain
MASREGPTERAIQRAHERVMRATTEIRRARIGAGITQSSVARRVGVSRARVGRIERGVERRVPAELLVRMAGEVGLELGLRAYPGPDPALDAAHRRLLQRLATALGPDWRYRTEVPLPIVGDKRAWDSVWTHRSSRLELHVEAETRLGDVQALLRRLAIKRRDGRAARMLLLVADTRHDRSIVRAAAVDLAGSFPGGVREALASLREGRDPGADALLLL